MPVSSAVCLVFQIAEERASYERNCEARRGDLKRQQTNRLQEFDLITATSGLDLTRIVEATEPASPAQPRGGAAAAVAGTQTLPSARQNLSSVARKESTNAGGIVSRSEMNLTALPYDSTTLERKGAVAPVYRLKDTETAVSRSELNLAAVQRPAAAAVSPAAASPQTVIKKDSIGNRKPPELPPKKPGRSATTAAAYRDELPPPQSTRL